MAAFEARRPDPGNDPPDLPVHEPAALNLLSAHVTNTSPAWQRLSEMAKERLRASGHPQEPRSSS
jgi:hypothetical protein